MLLNDHPTIGGYPKIANVILSDVSKIAQYPIDGQLGDGDLGITISNDFSCFHDWIYARFTVFRDLR